MSRRSSPRACAALPSAPKRLWEQFDFDRLPKLNRALVHDLATNRYIAEHAPVLIVGQVGVGKSHLAQALGHCAIRRGIDVVFASCAQLVATLNAARATGAYERKLATLARVPLLIIDDFGLKPLRPPQDEDLHDLIAERYERALHHRGPATWISPNGTRPFPITACSPQPPSIGSATNAYCIELEGPSGRSPKVAPPPSKSKLANGQKPAHS